MLCVIEWKWNGPLDVPHVPDRHSRDERERQSRTALPEAKAGPDQARKGQVLERLRAGERDRRQHAGRREHQDELGGTHAREPASRSRPGQGERHDDEGAAGVAQPPRAPHGPERVRTDHTAHPRRQRPHGCAHHRRQRQRRQETHEAVDPAQQVPGPGRAPQEVGGEDDLQDIPDRLRERGPDRELDVVVGEEVAEEHARPEREPTQVEVGDTDPHGQPDDRGHGAGEPELVAELRRAVVERRQEADLEHEAKSPLPPLHALPGRMRNLAAGCDLGSRDRHVRKHAKSVRDLQRRSRSPPVPGRE